MRKSLLFAGLVIILLTACRGRSTRMEEPIVEEEIEYRPLVTDSAAIDSIANSGMIDTDAALEIPDIPEDKNIDMNASDVSIEAIMSGSDEGE